MQHGAGAGGRSRRLPHMDSSQVTAALFGESNQGQGVARSRKKKGPPSKMAANIQQVRERSEQNRLAKLGQPVPAAGASRGPLRSGGSSSRSSASGEADTAARPARPPERDFVRENAARVAAVAAERSSRRSVSQQQQQQQQLHTPGTVPLYLVQRKLELASVYAEQLAEKERALLPPGMRILPEEERLATLRKLEAMHVTAAAELQALPFVAETVSQRRHQEQLEARVAELEDAIRVFSRPKVLVEA